MADTTNNKRSKKLIGAYEEFIKGIDKEVIKANLTFDKLKTLKSVLSDINNIFTFLATRAVAGKIADAYEKIGRKALFDKIEETNPNANGYDIEWGGNPDYPDNPDNPKILVEVKCNKPYLISQFGRAQLAALEKDIDNLLDGKGNLKGTAEGTKDYIKILAIVDFKDDDGKIHRDELTGQIQVNAKQKDRVDIFTESMSWKDLAKDKVYIFVLTEKDLENELDAVIKDLDKPISDSEN